jgi:hypothetical protein
MQSLLADRQESQKILSKLVAQSWLDEEFKQRFVSNPVAILEENGITLPTGVEVRVNENPASEALQSKELMADSNGVYEIPLPAKPTQLVNEQIQAWVDRNKSGVVASACTDGPCF